MCCYITVRLQYAVVITGCDSGFGEATSIHLANLGFKVISACYSKEGAARLEGTVAKAVVCDVTKEEDIANLVEVTNKFLTTKKIKLWGLVCNAGYVFCALYNVYFVMTLCVQCWEFWGCGLDFF